MKSTLAYALFWLNFFSTGTILALVIMDDEMKKEYYEMILYIDSGAMFLVFLFMISFCVGKNECCSSDEDVNNNFAIGSCYGACICCDCFDNCC